MVHKNFHTKTFMFAVLDAHNASMQAFKKLKAPKTFIPIRYTTTLRPRPLPTTPSTNGHNIALHAKVVVVVVIGF